MQNLVRFVVSVVLNGSYGARIRLKDSDIMEPEALKAKTIKRHIASTRGIRGNIIYVFIDFNN